MKLYFHPTSNPNKIALMMYEADIPFQAVGLNTMKGEQHSPEFRAINPNGKLPALDDNGVLVFDSAAILQYLADKTGKFLPPAGDAHRAQLLSWMAWSVSGLAVYSGQYAHLRSMAANAEGTYAYRRFEYEAKRHWKVLDDHLAKNEFIVGGTYTIAEMAMWGYTRMGPLMWGFDEFESEYGNVKRMTDWINARPAAAKVVELGDSFKPDTPAMMDAEAIKSLFAYAQPGDLVFN
jgi:GSH-dependent disulfide-bond oxidoreductase